MLKNTNKAPRGYKGLDYERVGTNFLDIEVKGIDDALKLTRDSWVEKCVSIILDVWKDARNCPLINVIVVSIGGEMFFKSMDCEWEVKDWPFITNILISSIEQMGTRNIVKSIDNTKNCSVVG